MAQAAIVLLSPAASLGSTVSIFGITVATSAGLTIAGSLLSAGVSLAVTAALTPDIGGIRASDQQANFQESVSPRLVIVGRAKVGGAKVTIRQTSDKLYILLVQGHRQITSREKHYVDGREVTLNSSGIITDPDKYENDEGNIFLQILHRDGEVPSTNYDELEADFPDWDETHRLDGLATALLIHEAPSLKRFNKVFPDRTVRYNSLTQGIEVFDPRTSLTSWTENPVLIIRDYIINSDELSSLGVDDTLFSIAADVCDEVFPTANGSDVRYRIGGTYSLTDDHQANLQAMANTCDGEIFITTEGEWGIRAGGNIDPTFTIDSKHIISVQISNGPSALDAYTTLKSDYTDEDLDYVTETIDPWVQDSLVTRYGHEIVRDDFSLRMVPSHHQARRLSKRRIISDNPIYKGVLRTNLHGLQALGERWLNVNLDYEFAGINYSGPARIEDISFSGGAIDRPDSLSYVDITFSILDPSYDQWDLSEEGQKPLPVLPDDEEDLPIPTGLSAVGAPVNGGAGILVSWDLQPYSSLNPVVEYKPSTSSTYESRTLTAQTTSEEIGGLTDGASYDVRVAFEGPSGTFSEYSTLTSVLASNT
ncbi:MAG: hypothetical protein AAF198_06190 [Pseudomonadota bacterium]